MDGQHTTTMEIELANLLGHSKAHSPKCFINRKNELIVVPDWNIYFGLSNVETPLDLKCKVVEWLSRPSCKGVSDYWQKRVRAIVNGYLGTDFDQNEMERIYTYLGNAIDHEKTIRFVESGFDLTSLPELPIHT